MKLGLLLVGLVFGVAVFLTLDWVHTARIHRIPESSCRVRDPVRHHGLKSNCATIDRWGDSSFEFFTNSLGFRDEKIAEVPLTDARPRILMLGDSFTEAPIAWRDSYVGRVAAHFPQYDFLNGAVGSYSPSNYLNTARMALDKGFDIDEAIVFIDISDLQDEAAFYRDVDAAGAVTKTEQERWIVPWYTNWRLQIAKHLLLTNYILNVFEQILVGHGYFYPDTIFDRERSAWTYRKVNETDPYITGYGPLGVQGGITKEKAKMTRLWQELANQNIPISVVVYPWPAQILHDTADSSQVRIWREWCEGKCKRFISLFPAFLAVKDQCPRSQPLCWYLGLFYFGDVHFNAAGNALVADAVIKSLTEQPPQEREPQVPSPDSRKEVKQPIRPAGHAVGG